MKLDFDTAAEADPMDAWATITLVVVSLVLSAREFGGTDLGVLHQDYRYLPDEAWRYLTSSILHGGWFHLLMNVYWIVQLGILVEALLGLGLFTAFVVFVGSGAGMAQWFSSGPSVGLSGIVYGLFGFLWALDRWHPRCRGVMNKRLTEFFLAWFLLCIGLSWMKVLPVANTAHGMGLALGAALGWAVSGPKVRILVPVALCGLAALLQLPAIGGAIHPGMHDRHLARQISDAIDEGDQDRAHELYDELIERDSEYQHYFGFER